MKRFLCFLFSIIIFISSAISAFAGVDGGVDKFLLKETVLNEETFNRGATLPPSYRCRLSSII